MGKSRIGSSAKLPRDQRSQFIVGPMSSWFMPNILDIWTQPINTTRLKCADEEAKEDIMDCDLELVNSEKIKNSNLSYFIYGSLGCFCYGEIHHYDEHFGHVNRNFHCGFQDGRTNTTSAFVTRLVDVKEDATRVSCVRFLKTSMFPIAMILTENGSLVIHDCLSSENLIHFKKSELMNKFVEPSLNQNQGEGTEQQCKKARFNHTQQINSCLWPNATNSFLAFSQVQQKKHFLLWLKVKDLTQARSNSQSVCKADFVESYEQLDLKLSQNSSCPICCMDSALIDLNTCVIAVAMDDGLITVVIVDFEQGQTKRVIKLARHNDQICSLSFYVGNCKKFPLGLLASISRSGLVLVWDVENEFYFADYQTKSCGGKAAPHINWFCLSFLRQNDSKLVKLAISNCESGVSIFQLPENAKSKIRLKEIKQERWRKQGSGSTEQHMQHRALLFNIVFDPLTNIIMTTSLDANHILWKCRQLDSTNSGKSCKEESSLVELIPQYLLPSMPKNSKTHMLRHSPIREDLMGVALGRAGVKFYKITENLMDCRFDMNLSCSMIARKIANAKLSPASLSWHPSHEYRLAIGTLEGKVFRVEINPRKSTLVEAECRKVLKSKLAAESGGEGEIPLFQPNGDIFDVEYQPLEREADNGYCDGNPSTKNSDFKYGDSLNQHTTDAVYSLCWGPNPSCPQDISRSAIYAVGAMSHRLFIYYSKNENSDKLTNYLDEFLDQSLPEAIGEASEVAWKPSMDLMALGTTTGKIVIVSYLDNSATTNGEQASEAGNKLFKKLTVIQGPLGGTYIQCLAWHPTTDMDDYKYYYIAASANESAAFVFNIRENILAADVRDRLRIEDTDSGADLDLAAGSMEGGCSRDKLFSDMSRGRFCGAAGADETTNVLSSYQYKLGAHKKALTDIVWSPHEPNELATSSFDRNAYVWLLPDFAANSEQTTTLPDARIVSKFSAKDRLFTLEWSLVDKDLLFTSGNDSTIWAWRPSENRVTLTTDNDSTTN